MGVDQEIGSNWNFLLTKEGGDFFLDLQGGGTD